MMMAAVPAPYLQKALEGSERHPAEAEPQTSGITTAIVLSYVESRGGRIAVERTLELAGLLGREGDLRDESTWWTFIEKQALIHAAADVLDDPQVTRRAGEHALDAGVGDGLKAALRAFGSPELLYANVARSNHKFARHSRMEVTALGDGHATIEFEHVVDVRPTRLDCLFNVGLLTCGPTLFGLTPARVSHPHCVLDGADACVYEVRWDRRGKVARWSPTATVAGTAAAAVGAAVSLLPLALVGAAAGLVGAAGWAGSATLANRRRRKDLEAELQTRMRSADSLRRSLRMLSSELDLESLLSTVTDRGRRALNADAFALLLEEEGSMVVKRAGALSAGSQQSLEEWLDERPVNREAVQIIDDLNAVDELAPLLAAATPLASLCSAPMPGVSGPAGVLVALSRNPNTFMAQDLDWIEAYAAQAGVALSNARLYGAQEDMARRDELTALGNRRAFEQALDAEVVRFTRYETEFSVAVLDLDGFKVVNDSDGHGAGDDLLRAVARALEQMGRAPDQVFRLGGDEFAVVMANTSTEEARAALTRTAAAAAVCDGRVGVSVGIATCPADGRLKDDLLRTADARLYAAKPPRRGDRGPDELL
jgi:diguanylate cyclase (GGDEF)-like protein